MDLCGARNRLSRGKIVLPINDTKIKKIIKTHALLNNLNAKAPGPLKRIGDL